MRPSGHETDLDHSATNGRRVAAMYSETDFGRETGRFGAHADMACACAGGRAGCCCGGRAGRCRSASGGSRHATHGSRSGGSPHRSRRRCCSSSCSSRCTGGSGGATYHTTASRRCGCAHGGAGFRGRGTDVGCFAAAGNFGGESELGAICEPIADGVWDALETGFAFLFVARGRGDGDTFEEHVGEVLAVLGKETVPVAVEMFPYLVDCDMWSETTSQDVVKALVRSRVRL